MNNYTEVIFLRTSHATSSISKITQNLAPIIFRNFFWKFTKLILFQRFFFICCKRQFSVCCSQNGNEMINSFFLKQIRCNLFEKILTKTITFVLEPTAFVLEYTAFVLASERFFYLELCHVLILFYYSAVKSAHQSLLLQSIMTLSPT